MPATVVCGLQTHSTHQTDKFSLASFFMMFSQQLPLSLICSIFEPAHELYTLCEGRDGVYLFLALA